MRNSAILIVQDDECQIPLKMGTAAGVIARRLSFIFL